MFNLPQLLVDSKRGSTFDHQAMIVKLRFAPGRRVKKTAGKNRHVALAVAALMTPATLMMFVMAMWCVGADVGTATEFPIARGLWSHWQTWIGATAVSHVLSVLLNGYGHTGELGLGKWIANALTVLAARQPRPLKRPAERQQGD